uniref:Uncharacterized protein n=1 Tax=Cacopsylla melanoneura TaxID=428564 RepID=A0A8D8QNP9_9HEMI
MALNNMCLNSNLEHEKENPRFHFHECPFIPKNNLSYKNNFIDEHTYKYYHINFADKMYNANKDTLNINYPNDDNKKEGRHINTKNSKHIYHNKQNFKYNSKKEKEINRESRSDDFPNRTHEGEETLTNHGRGKEKLLNPRKIICEIMKTESQEDGKHSIQLNKDIPLESKCNNPTKKFDASFTEMNESFEINDENEFLLSAKITITTDITHRKQCEHELISKETYRNNKRMNNCKHDYQLRSLQSKHSQENHKPANANNKTKEKYLQAELVRENKKSTDTETPVRILEESCTDVTLQEAEELKKLLCEKGNSNSKISDIYEEEQFVYDPELKQVSHSILTRSRASNFLEYFNQINNFATTNQQSCTIPPNEFRIKRSDSLDNIQLLMKPCEKNEMIPLDKRTLTKTISHGEPSHVLHHVSDRFSAKERAYKKNVQNDNPGVSLSNTLKNNAVLIDATENFQNPLITDETSDHITPVTLTSMHKRPELQKRYFYNEFKTYKRKHIEKDDVLCSDQVKSTKEKFEKIICKLIHTKRDDAFSNEQATTLKTQIPISIDRIGNLKNSQRFVSEDNICQYKKKSEEKENFTKNSNNDKFYQNACRADGSQNSLKIEFAQRKRLLDRTPYSNSIEQLFKLRHRTGSVDNLSTKGNRNINMKASRYFSKKETVISEDKVRENFVNINHASNKIENYNEGENFEHWKINDGEVHLDETNETVQQSESSKLGVNILNGSENSTLKNEINKISQDNHKNNKAHEHRKKVSKKEDEKRMLEKQDNKTSQEDTPDNKPRNALSHYDPDALESFGRPITEEVLRKIRECGTSITYFGGKVISRKYGPMCSPMTMTILNEIKQYMSVLNEHFHKPRDEGREI